MKPVYIELETHRGRTLKRRVHWWKVLLGAFAAGARRVPSGPVNYRSLSLSDAGLEYESLSKQRFSMEWRAIESLVFCRQQAAFPDLDGPYLETMWRISRRGGDGTFEVMDEDSNRAHLVSAFCECLPGFDLTAAERAFRSGHEGKWLCFERASSGEARPAIPP